MPATNLFDLRGRAGVVTGGNGGIVAESPLAWPKPELPLPFWHAMKRKTSVSWASFRHWELLQWR